MNPPSTMQVDEQPSPLSRLPSSHSSPPLLCRSPHAGTPGRPGTRHSKPGSTVLQSLEQPSPLALLPSSHASVAPRMPSPQTPAIEQMLGQPVHDQPDGIWQMALQPSPPFMLPSSHCSPGSITPLPHFVGSPTSMLGISGCASVPTVPPLPGPPLPLLPSTPVPPCFTPAQLPTERVNRAAATKESEYPLRIGGLLRLG